MLSKIKMAAVAIVAAVVAATVRAPILRRVVVWAVAISVAVLCFAAVAPQGDQPPSQTAAPLTADKLFARENLVAWCIVPFDAKKRGPEERAQMLNRLGFTKFAYDYRAEHIPTFDAELNALQQHGIALTAWWFPGELNDEARGILAILKKRKIQTQLWITGGGEATKNEDQRRARIKTEAARIRPIAEAAAAIGCRVGLYNHEGWFGEPENQLAILEELKMPNVGMVYNFHHGHDHLDRFAKVLKEMLPHLYAINLNGMVRDGAKRGQQILPLGQGDLDLGLLKTIRDSGYRGPIGILGHTQDDAEQRLKDNLDGLDWLVRQLDGKPVGDRPKPRTPVPTAPAAPAAPGTGRTDSTPEPIVTGLSGYCGDGATVVSTLPVDYDAKLVAQIVDEAKTRGDARRGLDVFCSMKFGCLSCHRVDKIGGAIGPPLGDIGRRAKPEEIVESVLWPRRQVKPEYSSWRISLDDGRALQGYKRGETAEGIELFDPTTEKSQHIAKSDIAEARELGTLMPDGVAALMTPAQRSDLARLLMELGRMDGLAAQVRPETMPAEFVYDRSPLVPTDWPLSDERVNRDRVYDFYRKEALFFRGQKFRPHLLPACPELDGGKFGHWGNQTEATWKDNRWGETDLGTVLSGVFHGPDGVVPKAVCVRLGEHGELAACFNPETLSYDALWRGGFLSLSPVRHGFLDGLRPVGEPLPRPAGRPPEKPFVYHGFYRSGLRVAFAYRIGDAEFLDAPWVKDGHFERIVAPLAEHPLRDIVRGGPSQWPQQLRTAAELGAGRPYAVDTIRPPFDNPWKAPMFFGDHDFLPDGSALLCTMEGDVWHVTGLDGGLKDVQWRRFASGLHQPLGLVVADGKIYVLGRDQITCLHDINGDGEADFYECFSNQFVTSAAGHDFICGLARDGQGRFYSASGKQGLLRISADGQKLDVLATGFRNPDGVALCPDGAVTLPCSEGDWTPASMICLVKPDSLATASGPADTITIGSNPPAPPHFGYGGPLGRKLPSLPLAYLPRGLDNSSGGQVSVPDDRWGPLKGQLIHFSYGQGSHFLVLRDEVDGQSQGAVIPLIGDFRSGVHRGRFNPNDGQLYASGMGGWGTYTPDDGCFQRVRYTGDRVQLPRSFHVHENGLLISFTQPIDEKAIANLANHFAQAWNYRYSPGYGSPELAPCHAGAVGHESLAIDGVHRIDAATVFVEMPALQPVNQLHLLLQVDDGRPQELFVTVHRLDKPFTQFSGYRPTRKIIAAHPLAVDLARLGKSNPNPWQKPLPGAVAIGLSAGNNLTYSTRTLRVKANENVKLTFHNPDVVPHNWVLVEKGALARVGDLTNKLVADPEAVLHQYVPKSEDVLYYTDITAAGQTSTIYFRAPQAKGRYPYLCTFPGHWMVMNGEFVVE